MKNTSTFERSVLAGVVHASLRRAADMDYSARLLGKTAPLPNSFAVHVADRASSGDLEVSRGDAVSSRGELGLVTACYRDGETVGALVEKLVVRRWVATHSAVVVRSGRLEAWHIGCVAQCVAWKPIDAEELLVLCQ